MSTPPPARPPGPPACLMPQRAPLPGPRSAPLPPRRRLRRFESIIVKAHPSDVDPLAVGPDVDLDWGDFFFNLVSMCIV
jgi:hypothetical protein